jgi:hypothetical protein
MSTSTRYTPLFETTTFPSPDGIDIILALWRDNDSGRECIQCDICQNFFLVNERRYLITHGKHLNNATRQYTYYYTLRTLDLEDPRPHFQVWDPDCNRQRLELGELGVGVSGFPGGSPLLLVLGYQKSGLESLKFGVLLP